MPKKKGQITCNNIKALVQFFFFFWVGYESSTDYLGLATCNQCVWRTEEEEEEEEEEGMLSTLRLGRKEKIKL